MRRPALSILGWALALGTIGLPPSLGADDPPPASVSKEKEKDKEKGEAPIYVIVDGANDLDSVRNRMDRPDFVILKGALYDALMSRLKPAPAAEPRRGVVEAVTIGGEILEDLAHLAIDYGIALTGPEASWVPIRLDGQFVSSAREGDRELPIRSVEGSWQVQLRGDGPHRVQVSLSAPVVAARGNAEGRRIELAIPEAASTRVQVVVGPTATEVAAVAGNGTREALATEPMEGGQRNRVAAFLTPRKRVELAWKIAADPGSAGPPLVSARGEIALEVERGALCARSSWEVRSEGGTLRKLELRIDPADELVGLECDGKPVSTDEPRDLASGTVSVLLPEPLGPGKTSRLVVTTRRSLAPETTARLTYRGVPFVNVVAQTGALAITQNGGDPWVSASPGRGLRAIDPRTDLPPGLKTRPWIVLAYRFGEQPFELGLQVDPSPPWVRVESRTTVTVDASRARTDCLLDYNIARGRVFEVRISVPDAMTLDLVGPDATVAASERLAPSSDRSGRVLVVRLTPKASEDGKFSVRLRGWQKIKTGGAVRVALPRPIEAQTRGGLLAVLAARNVSAELAPETSGASGEFVPAGLEPPATWPWPPEAEIAAMPPAFWLRHDEAPASIGLRLAARERTVQDETTVDAQIDRRRVDVRQETVLRVRFGGLSRLDLAYPPEIDGAWEVDGVEVARRETLAPDRDGSARTRLFLAREITDTARLRFRFRYPLAPALSSDHPRRLTVPRLRVLGAEAAPVRDRVAAGEGIDLAPEGDGWSAANDDGAASSPAPRLERTGPGPSAVLATAHAVEALPRVVASRLWLRSARDADGGIHTSASYRLETHDGAMVVALPAGAEWVGAKAAGESMADVESVPKTVGAYRIKLPTDASGPLPVTLDYHQPAARSAPASWGAPRLLDGGIVQETYWEVRIPWSLALVGVPDGWSDENRWYWNSYALMRRPAMTAEALGRWVSGDAGRAKSAEDPARDGSHAYLFAHVGDPTDMTPRVLSRAGLVGICSGVALALGLLVILARAWGRLAWVSLPVLLLAAAVTVPPSVILLLLQTSTLGFALAILAAITQRFVERRRPLRPGLVEPSGLLPGGASGLARPGAADPGSEASTVIRARAGTTVDRAPAPAPDPSHANAPS